LLRLRWHSLAINGPSTEAELKPVELKLQLMWN